MVNENDKILTWREIKALVGKNPGPFVHEKNPDSNYPFELGYHPTWERIIEEFPVIRDISNSNSATFDSNHIKNITLEMPNTKNQFQTQKTCVINNIFGQIEKEAIGKRYEYIHITSLPSFNITFTNQNGLTEFPNTSGSNYPVYFKIKLEVIIGNDSYEKVIKEKEGTYEIQFPENNCKYVTPENEINCPAYFEPYEVLSFNDFGIMKNSILNMYYRISVITDHGINELMPFNIVLSGEKNKLSISSRIEYKFIEEIVGVFFKKNEYKYCPSQKNISIRNAYSLKILISSEDNEYFHEVNIKEKNSLNPNLVNIKKISIVDTDPSSSVRYITFITDYPATYYLNEPKNIYCSNSSNPKDSKIKGFEKYRLININGIPQTFGGNTDILLGSSSENGTTVSNIYLHNKYVLTSMEIDPAGIGDYYGDYGTLTIVFYNSSDTIILEKSLFNGNFPMTSSDKLIVAKKVEDWRDFILQPETSSRFKIKYSFNNGNTIGYSDYYYNSMFSGLAGGQNITGIKLAETPKIYFKIKGNNKAINSSDKIFDIDSISISNLYLYGITLFINIDNVSTPFIIHEENSNEIDLDYSKGASLGFCIHNNTNSLETYNEIKNIKNNIVTLESVGFYPYPGFMDALNNNNISFMFNIFDNNNILLKNVYGDKSLTTYDIDHNILNVKIPNNITLDISKTNKFYISDLYTIKNYIYTFSLDSNKIAPIPSESWEENYYSHTLTELGYDYTSYPEGINIKEIILKFSNDKEIRFSSGESIGMYIDNDGKTGFKPSYTISQQCSFTDTPILKEVYININHKKKTGESFNKEYFSDFFQYMNEFGYGVGFIFFIKYETDETNTTSIKINPNYGIDFSWIIDTGDEYITLKYSNINESIGSANKNCKIKIQDFMTCSIP